METELIVRVNDLSRGGAGVSRDPSGFVIFIPFSAPGDLVKVRITRRDKRYAHAEIIEIIEASVARQTPRCPVFGRCGGCQWQHISYELQWDTKVAGVLQVLKRAGIAVPEFFDSLPAERIWEYRNRVQLRGEQDQLGFYQAKTRELVPVDRCDIAQPEINESWEQTRKEGARLGESFKVEVEVTQTHQIRRIWNSPHSAAGFRQVHDEQNEKLKEWIFQNMEKGDVLYDLFGGEGNLSFPFVNHIPEIHCVDLSSPRVHPQGAPKNLSFHRASVSTWLQKKTSTLSVEKNTALKISAILDPPREGLGNQLPLIASALEALNVTEIVLVGCDLDSWAKDLTGWISRSWALKKAMVLDLFPQTTHIESVAVLVR